VVLIRQGPHGKKGDTRWRIELLQRLQEVRSICKTRNHLLLNNSEVEQQLLRDTSYEALRSAPLSKQRQLLLMDYKKIEQMVDLINVPFLTNEATQ
jgi:hypothetical protein